MSTDGPPSATTLPSGSHARGHGHTHGNGGHTHPLTPDSRPTPTGARPAGTSPAGRIGRSRLRPCPTCPRPSTSSTPPCGTAASRRACRSPSTTSCGWPSSSTTSGSPSSRAAGPGPTPRTRSSSPGPRRSSRCTPPTLVAFGSTRRAGVKPEDDETLRPTWSRPEHRGGLHRGQVVGTATSPRPCAPPSTRRWPWWPTRSRFLRRARPAGLPRRRALLRRLPAQPRLRPVGPPGRRGGRGRGAGALRHQRRHAARRGGADRGRRAGSASSAQVGVHFHNDAGCAVANSLAAVQAGRDPGAGLRQRLRRAGRQRRPLGGHPRPLAQAASPHHPRRAPGAADPGVAPHRRAGQHRPQPAAALRRRTRSSPTRPACTPAPSPAASDAYEHVAPDLVGQRDPRSWSQRWPAGRPWP